MTETPKALKTSSTTSTDVSTWEPIDDRPRQPELEAPLTKRQLKHRRNKDSKLAKEFKRLEADINNLKSVMGI